jgi:hypothetical protein
MVYKGEIMGVSKSSYEIVSDTQITTKGGYLTGIAVMTDGTNDATAILYDINSSGDAAAGNKLAEVKVIGANNYGGRNFSSPVRFAKGLYLDLTGTGASAIVEYNIW